MIPLRLVTIAGSAERETQTAAAIAQDPAFELFFRCVDRSEALAALRASTIDAVVSIGVAPWFDFQCRAEAIRTGIRLFGLATDPIESELLEVAGFTVVPDLSHLAQLAHVDGGVDPPACDGREYDGKLIAVWGPKGSPGRTRIAIELAETFARSEPATLLVDADTYGGDVAQLLGLVEEVPGIVAISRLAARGALRDEGWVAQLGRAGAPLLLPGLLRGDLWDEVSPFGWGELLIALRRCFTTSVLDVGFCLEGRRPVPEVPARNHVALATLQESDRIVAVLRADPIGIRSFIWSHSCHQEVIDDEKLVVVVNRVLPGEEAEVTRFVRRHLRRPPLVLVPERPDHVLEAVWRAIAVTRSHPGSPLAEAVRDMAAALGGAVRPRGFLDRLAGRRAGV